MKHLQLYEKKFTINSLKKFATEKDELYELIKEYSKIQNLYVFEYTYNISNFYYEYNVEKVGDEVIIVSVIDDVSSKELEPYMISDVDDLNRFIQNPKVYINQKKYNL